MASISIRPLLVGAQHTPGSPGRLPSLGLANPGSSFHSPPKQQHWLLLSLFLQGLAVNLQRKELWSQVVLQISAGPLPKL